MTLPMFSKKVWALELSRNNWSSNWVFIIKLLSNLIKPIWSLSLVKQENLGGKKYLIDKDSLSKEQYVFLFVFGCNKTGSDKKNSNT